MAHVITETPTFTPTVTVPDGTDSRVNAAEVVTGIAQALANRTQSLKQVTDVAARTDNSVTFDGHITALGDLRCTDNATIGTDGAGNLTVNGQLNVKDNAVIGTDGTGTLTLNGPATIHGNVVGDQYLYNAPAVSRTITLNTPSSNTKAPEETGDTVKLVPGDWVNFSIPVPDGATMKTVKIKFSTAGCFYRARIFRKKNINMSDGSIPLNEEIATTGVVVGDPTTFNISLNYGDITASSLEAYSVSILNDAGSVNNMFVYVVQFTYAQSTLTNAGSF